MKGLYRKDAMTLLAAWPVMVVVCAVVISFLLYFHALEGMICFLSMFLMMQCTSTIYSDRSSGWTFYSVIFPLCRTQIVRSKYNLAAAFALLGAAVGVGVCALSDGGISADSWKINLFITAIMTCSVCALQIPLAYRLKKSNEFLSIVTSMLPAAIMIIFWMQRLGNQPLTSAGMPDLHLDLLGGMAAACIVLFVLSWLFVPGWLAKKDI